MEPTAVWPSTSMNLPNNSATWSNPPPQYNSASGPFPNGYANQNTNPNGNQYLPPSANMGPAPPMYTGVQIKKEAGMYGDLDIRSADKFTGQQVFPEQAIPLNHTPAQLSHPSSMNGPRQPVYQQYPVQQPNGMPAQYYEPMSNVSSVVPKYVDQDGMPMERGAAPGSMRYMPTANGMPNNRARPYPAPGMKPNGMVMGPKRMMMVQQSPQMTSYQNSVANQTMVPNPYGHESISPVPFTQQPMPPYNPQQKPTSLPVQYQRRPDPTAVSFANASLPMQMPMDNRNYPQYTSAPQPGPGPMMMRMGSQPANPMYPGMNGQIMDGPYNVCGTGQTMVPQRFNGNAMGPLEIKQFSNPMVGQEPEQVMVTSGPSFTVPPDPEPTMTLTQRSDPIIQPFRLEHGRTVTQQTFALRPEVYNTLMQKPDVQLELKCYRHDHTWATNWPDAITVAVNGTPVTIQRGQYGHRPLHIKQLCRSNKKNAITIHTTTCCCSHLFVLHVVHRPTVRSVIQHVLKNKMLTIARGIERLKSNFISGGRGFTANDEVLLPLRCPLSDRRINLPARSYVCQHIQCFDLESYLMQNSHTNIFLCPICKCSAPIDHLEVDEYVLSILKTCLSNPGMFTADFVFLDVNGRWRPNLPPKLHPDEAPRYNPVSPSTTISSWEHSSPGSAQCPSYPPERSVSVGRHTPKGPPSVGHPLCTGDYGSPASMPPATVPVSPTAKAFPGGSCPQKSPTPSVTADSRTPVPQMQSVHSNAGSNGSLPSTPRTPGSHPPSNNPTDFLDINFEADGDTDNDALQLISNMTESDLFSFFDNPTDPLGPSASLGSSFPNSAGAGSDSGISVASTNPANSSAEDILSLFDNDFKSTITSET